MGSIRRFNLPRLRSLNGAEVFFETGTWKGDGLAYACRYPFKKLYSSEIVPSIADAAAARFKSDPRVQIIPESSEAALTKYIHENDGPYIFWLDAHFPGAEEGLNDYNEYSDEVTKLPLQRELEIIAAKRNPESDIILIDDLRIYEEGNFKNGNLPDTVLPPKIRNIEFAEKLFNKSHRLIKSYKDEGYVLLLPMRTRKLSALESTWFAIQSSVTGKIV
jgi:hypothetical protein